MDMERKILASLAVATASAVLIAYLTRRKSKSSQPSPQPAPKPPSPKFVPKRGPNASSTKLLNAKHHLLRDFVVDRIMKRRGAVHIFETLPPKNTALVVIDMQRTFLQEGAPVEVPLGRGCVDSINVLAKAVRQRGGRVIWIAHANNVLGEGVNDWAAFRCSFVSGVNRTRYVESLSPGAKGQQIWPDLEVKPEQGDVVLQKNRYSALISGSSQLERVCRSAGLTTLLLAGVKTDVCVESTGRDAMMLDFSAVIVDDCCASLSVEEHRESCETFIQQFGDVMTTAEVVEALDRGAAQGAATTPKSAIA